MAARVITALFGLAAFLLLLFGGGWALVAGVVAILCFLGLWEFYQACEGSGVQPSAPAGFAAAGLLLVTATPWGAAKFGAYRDGLLVALLLAAMVRELSRPKRAPLENLGVTLLGVAYVGGLFSHVILLRVEGAALLARAGGRAPALFGAAGADGGAWLLLFVVFAVWANDVGAYFAGRAWGRRRLAPALSPAKTVEGAAGGFLATIVVTGLLGTALGMVFPAILLGAVVGVMGPLGDLWESALKRELGLKDFGSLLPGHGGVLDRFDSLLFAAPTIYYLLRLWPE